MCGKSEWCPGRATRWPGSGRALSLLLLAAAASSCAEAPRPGPPRRPDGVAACTGDGCAVAPEGCARAAPGCPCTTEGDHLECGRVEIQIANQTVCGTGDSVCSDGFWSPCIINNTAPLEPPKGPRPPGGFHVDSLGKPGLCAANPCDPACWDFLDTPAGEGNAAAGIAEDPGGGLTLLPVGPPPAVYVAGLFTRDYDATGLCAPGSTPVWGLWSWRTKTKSDAFVSFSVQTAATAAGLSSAPIDALQFSNPPGPSALAGQPAAARLGPPDTTLGSAIVDATLVGNGRVRGLPFLRVISRLAPSSNGLSAPVLVAWDLQASCAQSE